MASSSNMIFVTRSKSSTDDPASLFYVDKPQHHDQNSDAASDTETAALTSVNEDEREGEDNFNNRGIYYGCISCALADLNYSMLVAFFPESAKERSLNAFMIGILFSVFQFANLITCFLVPKVNRKLGGVKVLAYANLFQALATASMAFTGYLNDKNQFFAACFCLRALQGSMSAFSEISASGIVMRSVPVEFAGEVVMYIEATRIVGELAGPLLGGVVYGALGYGGPFLFAAGLLCTMALLMFALPLDKSVDNKAENKESEEQSKEILRKYTRMVSIICLFVCILVVSIAFTIMEPTLQPYLKKAPYKLSETMVGVVFISATAVFFLSAEIAEPFILWLGQIRSLMFGFTMIGISFFFIAPPNHFDHTPLTIFSFCRLHTQVPATIFLIFAMSINWFGGGVLLVLVNQLMVSEGEAAGFTVDSISDAIGMVLNIAFTAGATIGPLLGGFLTHQLDFPRANAVWAYIVILLTIIISISLVIVFERREATAIADETDNNKDNNLTGDELRQSADTTLLNNDPTKPLLEGQNII